MDQQGSAENSRKIQLTVTLWFATPLQEQHQKQHQSDVNPLTNQSHVLLDHRI